MTVFAKTHTRATCINLQLIFTFFFIDSTDFSTWTVGCMDASTQTFWFVDAFKDVDSTELANTCGSHFNY
jgi:hypothetical protein